MLDRADVGPVVAPAAHTHGKSEIGSHADSHASGGADPITPASIGAANMYASSRSGGDEDVNLYVDPGTYLFASSAANLPVGTTGYLEVTRRAASLIMQRFNPSSGGTDGREWLRHSADGTSWSSWSRTDAGSVTPEEIGAPDNAQVSGAIPLGEFGPGKQFTNAQIVEYGVQISGIAYDTAMAALPANSPKVADTGWRLLSPENGWTGEIRLRRFGSIVHFRARSLNGTAATSSNVIQIPSGFKPGPNLPAHGMGNKSSNAQSGSDPIGAVGGGSNDLVRTFGTITTWTGGSASIEWMTSDAFPATLPGTPA